MDALTWFLLAWGTVAFILYLIAKSVSDEESNRLSHLEPLANPVSQAKLTSQESPCLSNAIQGSPNLCKRKQPTEKSENVFQSELPKYSNPHSNPDSVDSAQPTQIGSSNHGVATSAPAQSKQHQQPSPQPQKQSFNPNLDLNNSPIPTADGASSPGESCEWLNTILAWLFRYYRTTPGVVNAWLRSLNTTAKKVANTIGCEVVFEEVLLSEDAEPPRLNAIRAEPGPRDHLTLYGHLSCQSLNIRLVSSQKLPDRLFVSNYEATITKLSGGIQARLACIANELFVMACFDGRPKMDIHLKLQDPVINEGGFVDQGLVEEAIKQCLVSAVTNLSLTQCTDLPQPVEEVFRKLNAPNLQGTPSSEKACANRLLINIVSAQRLGANGSSDVRQPYSTVEMDEPSQKHTTTLSSSAGPIWEESFMFDLGDRSEELLFEVYDKARNGQPTFLGLAIVGIEELRRAASRRHVLTLQSRPYRRDTVSGTLTVEFTFMDSMGMEAQKYQKHGGSKQHQPLHDQEPVQQMSFSVTPPVMRRPLQAMTATAAESHSQGDPRNITPEKPTLLVKSVSQVPSSSSTTPPTITVKSEATLDESIPVIDFDGPAADLPEPKKQITPLPSDSGSGGSHRRMLTKEPDSASAPAAATLFINNKRPVSEHSATGSLTTPTPSRESTNARRKRMARSQSDEAPSRRRNKSLSRPISFLDDLRTRLSFRRDSKSSNRAPFDRTASLDRPTTGDHYPSSPSTSYHRSTSTPASRDPSGSRRSGRMPRADSGSEASEASTDSLYHHSTLVVEITEAGIKKYYLIPPNMVIAAISKRLIRRGKKLHIFNEHTFVAVRISSSTPCNICSRNVSRGFGKQAYQCRDCLMVSHKRCHYRTESRCPHSTVSTLQMEYVWDQPS